VIVGAAFDVLLCLLILVVAGGAVVGRELFTGVALFVVYGLLLAIAWVRLGAVDVALAEGAIGAGLTGVLLLGAVARSGTGSSRQELRPGALVLCALLGLGLSWTVWELAVADPGLGPIVAANLHLAGAENPVTAVLLDFRGYDTLLESLVLAIALVGVWSVTADELWGLPPGIRQHVRPGGVLATFGRFLPPIGILVGVYLVWIGTRAPGGAFQAGTVFAAVWLLAMMASVTVPPRVSSPLLRTAVVAGPLAFLAAGLLGLREGAFLAYPPGSAKLFVLAIEIVLTASIAVTLALLVIGPRRRRE
jgi:multisubunit Na+/H+ antiporter MnhB subunit